MNLKKITTTVLLVLSYFVSISQSIRGHIYDKSSGEILPGVTVFVLGTDIGTSSDSLGSYNIKIKPGSYDIVTKYISYMDIKIRIVVSNKDIKQDIYLLENSSLLSEVEILSESKKESISSINIQRKNSSTIMDGISTDQFKRTPDKNASDVIKRITGITIQENKFLVIRGMSDRYNSSYINGSPLPSTESDRKAFDFNMIPSNLLDNIMVYKSPAPNLNGDFAGGVVMINTKSVPDTKISTIGLSLGYNSLATFNTRRAFRSSNTDFLGFDDGTRSIPDPNVHRSNDTKSNNVDFTNRFNNDWSIYDKNTMPNIGISYTYGNTLVKNKKRIGLISSISYNNSNRLSNISQRKFRYDDNILDQDFSDIQYSNNVLIGALFNVGYRGKHSNIHFKNLFSTNTDNVSTFRGGLSSGENGFYTKGGSNIFSQSIILSSQIIGEHSIKKSKIDWVINNGDILRKVPDYRVYSYGGEGQETDLYSLAINNNLFSSSTGRFYSDMKEKVYGVSSNYSYKMTQKHEVYIKAGASYSIRNRDFKSRFLTYYGNPNTYGTPEINLGPGNISESGVYMVEQSSPARDNYSAKSVLSAYYLMGESKIGPIKSLIGYRYESYRQIVNTSDGSNLPLKIDSTYKNILPSINISIRSGDKSSIKISCGKTVSRPEFRELATFPFYNFNLNSNISGNPNLVPSKIWNYDIRYELFPSSKDVISIGAFYKKIDNPIEMIIDVTQVSIRTFGYVNQKSAVNYGIELEYRKPLDPMSNIIKSDIWKKITIFTNVSIIKSKIEFLNETSYSRPLQGQSPFIVNSGLQFDDTKTGLGVSLSYNKSGRKISFVGSPDLAKFGLDIYENPRDVIDIQVSKTIRKCIFKLTAGDILSQDNISYQDINENNRYDNGDNTIFRYNMAKTITLSISLKIK